MVVEVAVVVDGEVVVVVVVVVVVGGDALVLRWCGVVAMGRGSYGGVVVRWCGGRMVVRVLWELVSPPLS